MNPKVAKAIIIVLVLFLATPVIPNLHAQENETEPAEPNIFDQFDKYETKPEKPSSSSDIFDQIANELIEQEEKFRLNLEKAKAGDADAQYSLGVMYEKGQGVRQDYAEAVKWYRKAGEQGYAGAQTNLDRMKNKRRSELFKLILLGLFWVFVVILFCAIWYTVIKQKHKGIQRLFIVLGTLGGYTATYSKFIGFSRRIEPYDIERLIAGLVCGALLIVLGSVILWVVNGFKIERR